MSSVMDTRDWSDEDWREELAKWDNEILLSTYVAMTNFNEKLVHPDNVAVAVETYRHARHCLFGAILERMESK